MNLLPEAAGPQDPVLVTAARAPGSVRRTTNIDTTHPGGLRADAEIDARARDLRTNVDGAADVVGEAWLRATVSPARQLVSLSTSPEVPALQQLIGASVASGFRSRLGEVATNGCEEGSLLFLLLDDLPGATLVSGYLHLRAGLLNDPPLDAATDAPDAATDAPDAGTDAPDAVTDARPTVPLSRPRPDTDRMGDLCAGWALDATMMVHKRESGTIPVPLGPPAPVIERDGDPMSWHAMAALTPQSVRRRRRLDLMVPPAPGGEHRIELHFRDSSTDEDGCETVMHEYTVTGTADAGSGRIVSVAAKARVLPWMECPGALASATRIAGMELSSLRPRIRKEFVGRSTCTHLNDSLRSLADIATLAREMELAPS